MVQYLPYSIYIVGLIGLILSHSGFGGQYLTPNSTFLNNEGIIVSVGIMLIGLSHFIYKFIELEKEAPKMAKTFYIAMGFGFFNIIVPLLFLIIMQSTFDCDCYHYSWNYCILGRFCLCKKIT